MVGLAQGQDLDEPVLLEVLPSWMECAGSQGQAKSWQEQSC